MSATAPQLVLGAYAIERELGRGGMGAIYLGVHQTLGKRAAIKVLLPELSRRDDLIARFWAEARAVTAIKHASIVDVYDYGVTPDGRTFIVMEYLEGETLGARLKARGMLPVPQAVAIARQIANALGAAHAVGVVHRDLKPDNVFLVPDPEVTGGERVKLLDFGVAKLAVTDEDGTAKTITGTLLGTPHYMSPEQCEGARAVDHRSDLYSLGCTLFQMVSGRLPFESPGIGGLIGMHLHVPPPKLRDRAGYASKELEAIVARLLEKNPEARFSSGAELAAALSAPAVSDVDAAASAPLPQQVVDPYLPTAVSMRPQIPARITNDATAPPPPPPTPATAPRKSRTRWAWLGASVSLVGVLALVVAVKGVGSNDGANRGPSTSGGGLQQDMFDADLRTREQPAVDASTDNAQPDGGDIVAEVVKLMRESKWIEAGIRARDLEATGMTRAHIAQILESGASAAASAVEQQVDDLVGNDDCGGAMRLAQRFEDGWGKVANRALLMARGCFLGDDDEDVAYDKILEAYAEGSPQAALALCEKNKAMPDQMNLACAFIACASKSPLQKKYIAKLGPDDRAKATEMCKQERENERAQRKD